MSVELEAKIAQATIDEWDKAVADGADRAILLEIGNGLRNFTVNLARQALQVPHD